MNRMLSSLSAVDVTMAKDILEYHFGNMSTLTKGMIVGEAVFNKYDTLSKEMGVALKDICDSALSGLTTDDVKAVVFGHIATLNANTRMAILAEASKGKFDTLINEFTKVSSSICQKAVANQNPNQNPETKGQNGGDQTNEAKTSDNTWMIYAGLAVVGAGAIYYFTKSGKKGKRRSKK